VSDSGDNLLSVFIGKGDGTFKPGVHSPVGTNPTSVAVADLNGDGKLDLVVTNFAGTVSILLGHGDGTFQAQVEYPAGSNSNSVTVGDFNGDGKLDLAVVNGNNGNANVSSTVSILINNGDGTFLTPVSYPLYANGVSVGTADFNGDGKLDLAVVDNWQFVVSIFLGVGDGTFVGRVDYQVAISPVGLTIGDFNGDGHLDLATVDSDSLISPNTLSVLLGNGDGTFQPQIRLGGGGSSPSGLVAGDFNRDGRLDVAIASYADNTVRILLQDGTVALSPPSLNFGAEGVGSSSTKKVTLTNVGTTTLTISSIAITGTDAAEFAQGHTCGSSLSAGASCTTSVTFTPSRIGPAGASLTITDNALGSPQSVGLSGTGAVSGPNATLSPTSLTFGTQLVGTTSSQSMTLSNYGTETLNAFFTITGADAGDFAQANDCGSSVAPGANCTINVTFKPTGINARTASLSITDNAHGSPQTVSLTGEGTVVELNPASLFFSSSINIRPGEIRWGTSTLTNTGSTTLNITGITKTGSQYFSLTNTTCGSSVAPGESCTITIYFNPRSFGAFAGAVWVSDNGGGSPQQLSLLGRVPLD